MQKSFSGSTREEARRAASEWWALQTGMRKIKEDSEMWQGDEGPSLLHANRWIVTIHYEREGKS